MERPAAPQLVADSAAKVRILLQSATHLVPGIDRHEKLEFVRNFVCQQHWGRDFDPAQERWYPYNDDFGLENRKCFFLVDHHDHDHTVQEEEVPVIWYKWTGESLVRIHEHLPSKIQKELKKWPFTWEGRKFHRLPKGPDGKYEPTVRRAVIRSRLRLGVPITREDLDFLRDHPEHGRWLKARLEHELWLVIEPFCQLQMKGGTE